MKPLAFTRSNTYTFRVTSQPVDIYLSSLRYGDLGFPSDAPIISASRVGYLNLLVISVVIIWLKEG